MTPREHRAIDARVAAAIGWTDVHQSPDPTPAQFGGKEWPAEARGNGAWWGTPPEGFASEWGTKIPPFSTDHNAAALVLAEMERRGWDWVIGNFGAGHWTRLVRFDAGYDRIVRIDGETLPEVICRAALDALDKTAEQKP